MFFLSRTRSSGRWALALVAIVSLGAAAQPARPAAQFPQLAPAPAVHNAIEANEAAFLNAVLAKDTATLGRLLADDFVYVHENGWISTKASFLKDYVSKGYVHAERVLRDPTRQYGGMVITLSMGHLQLATETPYPPTVVTHVWVEQAGRWVLAHRQEAHDGEPIGKQLPPEGGPNPTHELGSKPAPEVARIIIEHEAGWAYAMITMDVPRMDKLLDESLHYMHVIPLLSSKTRFMGELQKGFTDTFFQDMTLRQFGDVVLALHWMRFRHTNWALQSPSIVVHAWHRKNGEWVMVGRAGTRFASH